MKTKKYIHNFLKYRDLLKELIKRDIVIKYRRSVLGIFWSFLSPLLTMIVLTIVFSTLFARNIPNYPVYLLTGRLLFTFFSQGTKAAMRSIRGNAALIRKVYVPKYIFPLATALSNYVTFAISLLVLFVVMIATKVQITVNSLFFIFPIIYLLILTVGVGLILASLAVFFRDLEHLYDVFLTLLMYLTPIFYPAEIIPDKYQILLKLNPLFYIVDNLRDAILYGNTPNLQMHLISLGSSLVMLLIGLFIFRRKQDKFILYI